MTREEYVEMKQCINYDVAWQIFDEINEDIDNDRVIDLSCQDKLDAQGITKQKVYDVAMMAKKGDRKALAHNASMDDERKVYVLIIQTTDDHLDTRKAGAPTNVIETVVRKELGLDCHYLAQYRILLVLIDESTHDLECFKD